jgi:hypothetical protein
MRARTYRFRWLLRRGEVGERGGGRRPAAAVAAVVPLPERRDAPAPGISPRPGPLNNTKETSGDHCHHAKQWVQMHAATEGRR